MAILHVAHRTQVCVITDGQDGNGVQLDLSFSSFCLCVLQYRLNPYAHWHA